jgi:hypothetical protein
MDAQESATEETKPATLTNELLEREGAQGLPPSLLKLLKPHAHSYIDSGRRWKLFKPGTSCNTIHGWAYLEKEYALRETFPFSPPGYGSNRAVYVDKFGNMLHHWRGSKSVDCKTDPDGFKSVEPTDPEWPDEEHVHVNVDMTLAEASIPLAWDEHRDGDMILFAVKGNTTNLFVVSMGIYDSDVDDYCVDDSNIWFVGSTRSSSGASSWEYQLSTIQTRSYWDERRSISKGQLHYCFPKYRYTGVVKPYEDLYIDAAQILGSENF